MALKIRHLAVNAAVVISALTAGCAATQMSPEAARIIASPNPPPKGCHYVGQVTGNQGNFFTGGFTSNKNLEQGAINSMKNDAAKMDANYIQLMTNRAGQTGSYNMGSGNNQQTNVVMTGNAYKCKNLET